MRKTRQRTSKDHEMLGKSSSDESEHQNTMNIIDKMSKKLMAPKDRVSRNQKSKVQSKPTQSSTPAPRLTRSRSKSRRDRAYEGDIDSATSTATSSDGSTDMYDFDQSNEDENLCLVLFPTSAKRSGPGKKSKKDARQSTLDSAKLKKKSPQRVSVLRASENTAKQTKSTPIDKISPKQKTTKRKLAPPDTSAPLLKKSHIAKVKKDSVETSMFDSGVFMSPIERIRDSGIHTPDLTPIPTPSLSLSESTVEQRIPSLQFDSLLEDPLTLSPVKSPEKRPRIEPMDLGSPRLKTPTAEKTYAHRGLYQSPSERLEKKKKQPKGKPRVTTKRVDAWATQMNAEFNEIEMYDLSIEDQ